MTHDDTLHVPADEAATSSLSPPTPSPSSSSSRSARASVGDAVEGQYTFLYPRPRSQSAAPALTSSSSSVAASASASSLSSSTSSSAGTSSSSLPSSSLLATGLFVPSSLQITDWSAFIEEAREHALTSLRCYTFTPSVQPQLVPITAFCEVRLYRCFTVLCLIMMVSPLSVVYSQIPSYLLFDNHLFWSYAKRLKRIWKYEEYVREKQRYALHDHDHSSTSRSFLHW